MNKNTTTILITGGAGFIGSNLGEYFIEKGYKLRCLDNFSTGHRHNLAGLIHHDNFTLIEGTFETLKIVVKQWRVLIMFCIKQH